MKQKNYKFLFVLSLTFFILFILSINNSFASAPEMINTGYNSNLMVYDRTSDKFYLFSISNNFKDGYGSYTDDSGQVKKVFYLQRESNNNGIGIYRIHSYRVWENNEWVVQKNIGHTSYDSFNINIATTFDNFYIVSCSSSYKTNDVVFPDYSSLLPDFYQFPAKEEITVDTFKFSEVLSKNYSSEFYETYNAYISLDGVNWDTMSKEYSTVDDSAFIFYYDVFENGTYQVRVFDESTGQYIYDDFLEVDNIPFEVYPFGEIASEPYNVFTSTFKKGTNVIPYVSTDKINWTMMEVRNVNSGIVDGIIHDELITYDYYTRIDRNGTYYFRFLVFEKDEEGNLLEGSRYYYFTMIVDNFALLDENGNPIYDEEGNLVTDYMSDYYVPKPDISINYNKEKQCFIIRTQKLIIDKALNMKCYYTSDINNENFLNWTEMEIEFENYFDDNTTSNVSYAYFYFEIPIMGSEDTDYKIVFYNYVSGRNSNIVTYEFRYEKAIDYIENELKIDLGFPVKFNNLLKYMESRFGFFTYPFKFTVNALNRLLNINYEEPCIHIPELHEPFYNKKILDSIEFNFNSLLENTVFLYLHNIYLVAVDFLLIFLFIKLCAHSFDDVMKN